MKKYIQMKGNVCEEVHGDGGNVSKEERHAEGGCVCNEEVNVDGDKTFSAEELVHCTNCNKANGG